MTLEILDNLVKINQLKLEPPDQKEFDGMVASAKHRLQDAKVEGLSEEGRYSLVYGAAHAISLAAMRWHGYRSDNRYLVFQCLQHTVGLENVKWRVQACRYLVKDFGTSQSPKSTRQRDNHCAPAVLRPCRSATPS